MTESEPEIKVIENSINEYYKLKTKYETDIMKNKKKIINNQLLSWNEKRREYKKLIPKCINCKKPGGTIFSIQYNKDSNIRQLKAICGVSANPCNLNILINVGKYDLFPDVLKYFQKEIYNLKQQIISDKNNILFGYFSTEQALERFAGLKEEINDYTSLLESYLEEYMMIIDNNKNKQEIIREIEYIYGFIEKIKEAIKNFNTTNNTQYVHDAVEIYTSSLKPVADKLLKLKYKENMVWYDEDDNVYRLIQNKYTIHDIEFHTGDVNVVKFDSGIMSSKKETNTKMMKSTKTTKPLLIIDSSKSSNSNSNSNSNIENNLFIKNSDGTVKWNDSNYQKIWDNLSTEMKEALLTDDEWMENFITNCVNLSKENKPCKFTGPSDLILPPHILDDDKYDLGNEIYSKIFNNLDKSYQKTLLTLYSSKDGVKDYSMLDDTLNNIVAKDLHFQIS